MVKEKKYIVNSIMDGSEYEFRVREKNEDGWRKK
jgi:hypothetical protein